MPTLLAIDMKMFKEDLEKQLIELVEREGFEFVEMKLARHGKNHSLRIFADREGGITLDQCGELSRAIGRELDRIDPFESAYTLEVSSPGLDRPLEKVSDFRRSKGERVRVQLVEPLDGATQIEGMLDSVEQEKLVISTDKGAVELRIDQVKRGKIVL